MWSRVLVIVAGLVLIGSVPAAAAAYTVPVQPPADAPPIRTWQGTWQRLPSAPMVARTDAVAVAPVFSDRVIVWGGRDAHGNLLDDGAIYNVRTGTWRDIGAAPIGPRSQFGFDSDNEGIVIWGGIDAHGTSLNDGAAWTYRPDARGYGWQTLPEAPLPAGVAAIGGDTNGEYVISENAKGRPVMAVLDDGGWQSVDVPLPHGVRYEVISPVYDTALVISYQADGFALAARYHDYPAHWDSRLQLPLTATATGAASRWLAGWFSRTDQPLPGTDVTGRYGVVARVDAIKHAWQSTETVPAGVLADKSLTWSPRYLVSPETLLAFDPVTGGWLRLPALPGGQRTGVSAAWAQGHLYLYGGRRTNGSLDRAGWVFTPSLPANTYDLPGDFADGYGDCGGVGTSVMWHLRGDAHDPMLVWLQHGDLRVPTFWPDGVTVHFGATMRVIGPDGGVIAKAGDFYSQYLSSDLSPCWNGSSAWFIGVTAP